jgi:hypothetical protein
MDCMSLMLLPWNGFFFLLLLFIYLFFHFGFWQIGVLHFWNISCLVVVSSFHGDEMQHRAKKFFS